MTFYTSDGTVVVTLQGGEPGATPEQERPAWRSISTAFELNKDVEKGYLVWHISSWHYSWTGPWKSPSIRPAKKSSQRQNFIFVREFTLMGILLGLLFQHLNLYRRQPDATNEKWFVILLLVFIVRQVIFARAFETFGLGVSGDWFHFRRCMEYAIHPLSAVCLARVTQDMLEAERFTAIYRWLTRILLPMSFAPFLFLVSGLRTAG